MKKLPILFIIALVFVGCQNQQKPNQQETPSNYDMAIMDGGKLVLYDLAQRKATPIEAEKDSLFNAVFTNDNCLYYSVKQGDNTLLKYINLNDASLKPQSTDGWNLPWNLCYGTDYFCNYAPMLEYHPEANIIGMSYMMDPDYGFSEFMVYDRAKGKTVEASEWDGDLSFLEDYGGDEPFEGMFSFEDMQLSYMDGGEMVCLTNNLDLGEIDPEWADELSWFGIISVDPTERFVIFKAAVEIGDDMETTGPQCLASLDGKIQTVLGDFDESYPGQWLPDGTLVYSTTQGIFQRHPDGKVEKLYPHGVFILR